MFILKERKQATWTNTLPKLTSLGSLKMTIPLDVAHTGHQKLSKLRISVVRDHHMWAKKVQAR